MNPLYRAVAARANHRCEYCRAPEAMFNFPFEVEHVVPACHGGADVLENTALACRSCNLHKSDKLEGLDSLAGVCAAMFDPRRDAWQEHFTLAADGTIQGLSGSGRATVSQLRFNSPAQVAARKIWSRLGQWPA